jgi:hypothetical protein
MELIGKDLQDDDELIDSKIGPIDEIIAVLPVVKYRRITVSGHAALLRIAESNRPLIELRRAALLVVDDDYRVWKRKKSKRDRVRKISYEELNL